MPQHGGVGSIGADGASGAALYEQAMSAGYDVIAAMIAQTAAVGYIRLTMRCR